MPRASYEFPDLWLQYRPNVIGIFPNHEAVVRLVGARSKMTWAISRSYTPVEKSTAMCTDPDAGGTMVDQ